MSNERAIAGKKCYNCGKTFKEGEYWWYWYHGDQDDRVCENCAKSLIHHDTAYAGTNVFSGKRVTDTERKIKRMLKHGF